MKILVCGGRDFKDYALLISTLDPYKRGITLMITGVAPGADRMADEYARKNNIDRALFPPNWVKHGKRAGPIRNQYMIDLCKPDLVIAFPGGRGTANTTQLAEIAGIEVISIEADTK